MRRSKPRMVEMSDAQMMLVACVALRNAMASLGPVAHDTDCKSLVAMLDKAIEDGRDNATMLALSLLLANAASWEAATREEGRPSLNDLFDTLRAQTGGGRLGHA